MHCDGGLGLSRYHTAVVPSVPRAGSLDDQGADDHEDLLAGRDLCRPVLAGNEISGVNLHPAHVPW